MEGSSCPLPVLDIAVHGDGFRNVALRKGFAFLNLRIMQKGLPDLYQNCDGLITVQLFRGRNVGNKAHVVFVLALKTYDSLFAAVPDTFCLLCPGADTTANLSVHLCPMQEALQDLDSVPLEVVVNRRTMFVSVRLWLTADRKFHDDVSRRGSGHGDEICPRCPVTRQCLVYQFEVLQMCGPSYTLG